MVISRVKTIVGVWLIAVLAQPWLAWAGEHAYRVVVDEELREVLVRAELMAQVDWLSARDGDVSRLSDLTTCAGDPLPVHGERIVVGPGVRCLTYRYPLHNLDDRRSPPVAAGVVISSPSAWLWVPSLSAGEGLRIELVLPEAMNVSVPWRAVTERVFELSASPQSSRAAVVFGQFEQRLIDLPGAQMRVALIDGPQQTFSLENKATEKIVAWLHAAGMDVVRAYGRFPNPNPQIIVQPSAPRGWGPGDWGGGGSPVPFGFVIRDGGETVRFFVAPERPLDDYLSDWTATHEFSHLLLPYVRSRDKWISEGFASYYQNVLLARRGVYTEQHAWRRLHRAFEKARATDDPPQLRRISDRPFWEVRMLIYWSGAAIALLADEELRRLSGSVESLDSVLGRLQACCLPSERAWTGEELFAKLDELSKYPIFSELYRRHAYRRGMPQLDGVYKRLGVIPTSNSNVRLSDSAENARVRKAIMKHTKPVGADLSPLPRPH
jgi:hypothetical protein